MNWTKKQLEFLTAVEMGRNIYLSGFAGTGKSTVVIEAMRRLDEQKRRYVACAPTGRAANNINGETIHSFFRINPFKCFLSDDPYHEDYNKVNTGKKIVMKKAETFFFDEASMVRVDITDAMNLTLIKNTGRSFKSKQVVFIGDLKQLPPIVKDNEASVLATRYDGVTFLDSEVIKELDLLIIDLDEIVRQTDIEFIQALSVVRNGGKASYFRRFITNEPSGVVLAPRKETVARYNDEGLNAQEGDIMTFTAEVDGNVKAEDYSFEYEIKVKNGCKIMYLVNSKDNPLRNGTIGTFTSRVESNPVIKSGSYGNNIERKLFIKIGETEWPIEPYKAVKWEYVYDKEADAFKLQEKGSITQYPFKLAYAMSIHKSQGMTFDDMTVDLRGGCFIKEQYYVALSRATGPDALRIII
jgi:ATP-dependent exoDNAse (exonuclease V) alpha subunit